MNLVRTLIVEDDPDLSEILNLQVSNVSLIEEVLSESTASAALETARSTSNVAVIVLDLGLPDRDGLDLLPELLAACPHAGIICLTGRDEARSAVRALEAGALAYLVKPWDREELAVLVRRALHRHQERMALELGRKAAAQAPGYAAGRSPTWAKAIELARDASESPTATVLIRGESGTGKEVIATLVHAFSPRSNGSFVTSNVASIPAGLVESELFGHEAGAFSGATGIRRGLFELASNGSLFLDEIGEMPLELQPRLLRVLEGHPFRRVGGEREIRNGARIIAATHRNLEAMVGEGRFRADLLYRLNVVEIRLPALRERREDIEPLAVHFLGRFASEHNKHRLSISPPAIEALVTYHWPGNVRELRNTIERAVVRSRGGRIELEHLAEDISLRKPKEVVLPLEDPALEDLRLETAVKKHIEHVWARCGGNLSRTARTLDLSRGALRRRLRDYGTEGANEELVTSGPVVTDEPDVYEQAVNSPGPIMSSSKE